MFSYAEGMMIPTLDKIVVNIEQGYRTEKECINHFDEIKEILPFVLMFYFRSGALLHEYEFSSENPKLDRVERMLLDLFDVKYIVGLCKTILNCYEFAIIIDEQERFLISDQYLSTVALRYKNRFSNASNRQIGMKDTMILLPLSAKFYMVFYNGRVPSYIIRDRFNVLSDETVREINNVIYQNSYVKCVGKYEDELIRVKDIEMGEYSPTECIMKYEDGSIKDYVTKKEVFLYDEDKDMCKNSINYMMDYEKKIKGKMQRNDLCICNSGKKYKKCCMKKYETAQRIVQDIRNPKAVNYSIPGGIVSEMAIEVFSGKETEMKNSKNKDLIKQMEEMIQQRKGEE